MSGGFSYPLSQLNRTSQALRQPGSAIKPLSYLAALGKGLQPNTLVTDEPITLPPIGGGARSRAGLLYACQASWNSRCPKSRCSFLADRGLPRVPSLRSGILSTTGRLRQASTASPNPLPPRALPLALPGS